MNEQVLQIKVTVDAQTGQLKVLGATLGDVEKKLQQGAKSAGGFKDGFGKMTEAIGLGNLTALTAYDVLAKTVGVLADGVKQAIESEQANRRLAFTLLSVSDGAYKSRDAIRSQVEQMTEGTRFTKTESVQAYEQLLRYTKDTAVAHQLLQVAMKASDAGMGNLVDLSRDFGMALQFPDRGIQQLRAQFPMIAKDASNVGEAFQMIADGSDRVRAETDDSAKEMAKFKRNMEEMIEEAGAFWLPILNNVAKGIDGIFRGFEKYAEHEAAIIEIMKTAANPAKAIAAYWKQVERQEAAQAKANATTEKSVQIDKKKVDSIAAKNKETVKELTLLEKMERMQDTTVVDDKMMNIRAAAMSATDDIAGIMRDTMVEMTEAGMTAEQVFASLGERIKAALINAVATAIAESLTRMAIMGILNMFMPGGGGGLLSLFPLGAQGAGGVPVGLAYQLAGGATGGLLGSRAAGGPVPQTGPYLLHAGEYVSKPGSSGSGGDVHIHINALDTRTLDAVKLQEAVAKMIPELKRQLGRR